METFIKSTQFLTAGMIQPPAENDGYEGTQYSWKAFVFRPAQYQFEAVGITLLALYLVAWRVGWSINRAKARDWALPVVPFLSEQFTYLSPKKGEFPMRADGCAAFLAFASGRRGLISFHQTVSLIPRQDPFLLLYNFLLRPIVDVRASPPVDLVTLDATLLPIGATVALVGNRIRVEGEAPGLGGGLRSGSFAITRKEGLNEKRKGRWDLSFPTVQSDHKDIDPNFAIISEHVDITQALLAPIETGGVGLYELLSDPETKPYFESLVISDVPYTRPIRSSDRPSAQHAVLTFRLTPSPSITLAFYRVLMNLVDSLTSPQPIGAFAPIRAEITRKLRKTRVAAYETIDREVTKAKEPKKEEKSEIVKKKKEEKKKGLSAAELKKIQDLQKKREERKQATKQAKK